MHYAQIVISLGKLMIFLKCLFEVLGRLAVTLEQQFYNPDLIQHLRLVRRLGQSRAEVIHGVQVGLLGAQFVAPLFKFRGGRVLGRRLNLTHRRRNLNLVQFRQLCSDDGRSDETKNHEWED